MKHVLPNKALTAAVAAARAAGAIMRKNLRAVKQANEVTSHDIKLELDVRCQKFFLDQLLAPHVEFELDVVRRYLVRLLFRAQIFPHDRTGGLGRFHARTESFVQIHA